MIRHLIFLPLMILSTLVFAAHRNNSTVNCGLIKVDASASQSLHRTVAPTLKTSCATRVSHGYPVPDPKCTPGAINPTITLHVLQDSRFRTSCLRNHASNEYKKAETYKWYTISHPHHNVGKSQVCELDHLVSLELGGADTLDNIWPQCGPKNVKLRLRYFKQKDIVENYLAKMVKTDKMNLADVQRGIAKDWTQYLAIARKACPTAKCKQMK